MTLSDIEHKNIALWGLGAEGLESFRYLRRQFPEKILTLINRELPKDFPADKNTRFIKEDDLARHLIEVDVVVKSPGISLYHPLISVLNQNNIVVTSATNIWFAQRPSAPIITITGSNGKSTTSALLAHILNGTGFKAGLGGNIGVPLLSLDTDADYYVVELSSYQTADLRYAPDIAVLLNLFPEHIQWHQSHDQYFQDKCHLIHSGANVNILNRTDANTKQVVTQPPEETAWFNDLDSIHCDGKFLMSGTEKVGTLDGITLPGQHNLENICAALTVCQSLGLDLKNCFKLAADYTGLPHRLETLGTVKGHRYINDSISTTPEATLAALKSFEGQNITLLAGGQDREQDFALLADYIAQNSTLQVITFYETGPRLLQDLSEAGAGPRVHTAHDLKQGVGLAQKITPEKGLILLSPAAPSYDAFNNFQHRGSVFKQCYKRANA